MKTLRKTAVGTLGALSVGTMLLVNFNGIANADGGHEGNDDSSCAAQAPQGSSGDVKGSEQKVRQAHLNTQKAQRALEHAKRTRGKSDDKAAQKNLRKAQAAESKAKEALRKAKETKSRTASEDGDCVTLPTPTPTPTTTPTTPASGNNPAVSGTFTGAAARDGVYGQIAVTIGISKGIITTCSATYPSGGTSGSINTVAIPSLCSETIQAQSANIAAISGASYTSPAFKTSLASAILKAGL